MTATLDWRQYGARTLRTDPSLRAAWDRLNQSGLNMPFMAVDVVCAALDAFGSGNEVLLCGRGAGRERAMMLLAPRGRFRWSTFQPSQLPLGAWVAEHGLSPDHLAKQVLASRVLGGLCLELSMTQVDPVQSQREVDGPSTRHDDYVPTAWLEVSGTFDDYWAARGKNLRQNLRKQRNKLAAEGTAAEMRIWREQGDMAPALIRFGELEGRGWKAEQGTAIRAGNAQGRFYTEVFECAAGRGEALLTEYLFDGRTVAMNLGLQRGGTWVVLKTAYDESVAKSLSPASLLRETELVHFFQPHSGIERIEYYGRVMEWHTKLTDQQRMLYHVTCFRWSWLKRLAAMRRGVIARPGTATPRGQSTGNPVRGQVGGHAAISAPRESD
ncbi:MAG: GNAT family N-acetyltransferase [Rubrivivax sp.]|nr:GNAT family N-acetyltransferase [Rubrivivax sp.]